MLTVEALNEAMPLTESLDSQDIVLEAIEDTPLARAVNQTVILDDQTDKENPIDLESSVASTNAVEKVSGGSEHDLVIDEIVKAGADAVRGQVLYAKNVVQPKLKQFIDLVEEDIALLPVSGLSKYQIKTYDLPEIFQSDGFKQSLDLFANTEYQPFSFDLNLPDIVESEFIDLIKTGSQVTDGFIDQWIARVGIDFIYSVYQTVFQIKQNTDADYSKVLDLRVMMNDKETGTDTTIAIYLLSNKLYDNPPENTNNSLDSYNAKLLVLRNQSGNKLFRIKEAFDLAYENNKIVKEIVSSYCVEVFSHVYADWINNGGSNEVLLGSLLADRGYYTVSALNEDSEKLKALWENNKQLEEKTAINNKFVYVKESLQRNFSKLLAEDTESSIEDKNTYSKIFSEELKLIKISDLTDICAVCLKLLGRSMFYRSDAERFLTSMDKVTIENPSINPREAALISAIELATDYLCAQIKVVSAY